MIINPFAVEMRFDRRARMRVAELAAFASTALLGLAKIPLMAQATIGETPPANVYTTPEWQIAAGGHMSFEVASIRPGDPGKFIYPTIDLSVEDTPIPSNGYFKTDFSLPVYIEFAYKIMLTPKQEQTMVADLPKWVGTQPFVIEAKAPTAGATKDQIRLMMQSLLASRFKLAVHFETQEQPALGLVLDRPGKLGPRLRPHALGLACDAKWSAPPDRTSPSVPPGEFLPVCGAVQAMNVPDHTILFGARNVTMQSMAGKLGIIPPVADFGRPVVDQTGLAGTYDFSLNWLPDRGGNPSGATEPLDAQGPSFEGALKSQLGLKLKPTKAPIQILVIDHVEQPSPN
jgi:bla regulator protein blaR1